MKKCYYDQNDLTCQEVAKSVQDTPTPKNLEDWFEEGHLYVYDAPFLREICLLNDNIAWTLFETCPYERFCQFDYAASLAVDKYIQEAKQGLYSNTDLDTSTQIVTYAVSLSPNSTIEIESETQQRLLEELGKELFQELFYKACGTQADYKYLNEIQVDQVFYRDLGSNFKLARLRPNTNSLEFDLCDDNMFSCYTQPWTIKDIAVDDLNKNWRLMG